MEKGLQPNALAGTQGSWEQLGPRMPVLRVWHWLQHLTPATRTYALCSAVC